MQSSVFKDITTAVVETTCKWTQNALIIDRGRGVKKQFDMLNEAFSLVHKDLSHTGPIPETSLPSIKTNIDSYVCASTDNFTTIRSFQNSIF